MRSDLLLFLVWILFLLGTQLLKKKKTASEEGPTAGQAAGSRVFCL